MTGPGLQTVVVLGTIGGAGAWLAWIGWQPQAEPLARTLARFGQPAEMPERITRGNVDQRLGHHIRQLSVVGRALEGRRADLNIVAQSPDDQAAMMGAWGLLGLFAGVLALVPRWTAGIPVPTVLAGWIGLLGALAGFLLPLLDLREQAERRRKSFLHAVSAYCISVDMCLQIGAGPEQALTTAASDGQGWQFVRLRSALAAARARNSEPWNALRELGEEIAVPDLVELARTIEHTATHGAAASDTVADSIQERIAADIERDAARTTVRMAIPATMLLMGFMVLMAYPAVASVLDTY